MTTEPDNNDPQDAAGPEKKIPAEPPAASEPAADDDKKKIAALEEKIIRMQADFDNFRKRLAREKEDSIRFSNQGLLEELLPVVDNFELGLKAAETAADAKSIVLGLQMVKTQLERLLKDSGVTEIEALGTIFDPHVHDAVSKEESAELPEGTIIALRRKGYRLRDRLLRPASVVVAHRAAADEASGS